MAAQLEGGPISWSGSTDIEGHRTYKVTHRINVDPSDGPQVAMDCEDLPQEGDIWAFGTDLDQWAWCTAEKTVEMSGQPKEGYPNTQFKVTQTFTAKPAPPNRQRCNDIRIEDPLLEPVKIRVSTTQDKEEAAFNVYGFPITNSAWEQLRGPQVEFNKSSFKVRIEKNVPFHNLPLIAAFRDTVNKFPMWGMPPRTILLSSVDLDRKYLGQCVEYWTLTLEFEVNDKTWDRYLLDEGTKVLHGDWDTTTGEWVLKDINGSPPNPFNPSHFDQFKDKQGENCRVILNGKGLPAGVVVRRRQPEPIYYVRTTSGTGVALSNTTVWIKLVGGTFFWNPGVTYNRGNIVLFDAASGEATTPSETAEYYLCATNNTGTVPNVDTTNWWYLPNGVEDKGTFSLTANYTIGDRVTPAAAATAGGLEPAGTIFVQKYLEADHLLLGVPPIF